MTDRQMLVDIQNAFCLVSAITARVYGGTAKTSIPIMDLYDHYGFLQEQMKTRAAGFSHPQLYAVLSTLFGESTTLYDDYKCSFAYPFRLEIYRQDKIVEYLFRLTDYKGAAIFNFRKVLSNLGEYTHHRGINILRDPIEGDFSRDEMSYFMT
jgi:hypothetical protein